MNTLFIGKGYVVQSFKEDGYLEITVRNDEYRIISTDHLNLKSDVISFCFNLINTLDYKSPTVINVFFDDYYYEFKEFYPAVIVKKISLPTLETLFSRHFITELSHNFINEILNENELHSS